MKILVKNVIKLVLKTKMSMREYENPIGQQNLSTYHSHYYLHRAKICRNLEGLWLEVPEGCTQRVKRLRGTQRVLPVPDQTAHSLRKKEKQNP